MSTLFKHKAAKVRCRGSDQDINTIGMSRQQTNLSALDTEALSMEPGKVFKQKNRVTCTEIWAGWFSFYMISKSPKWAFDKKNQLWWCHSRAAQSLTGRVRAHFGQFHPAPDSPTSTSSLLEQWFLMRKSHQQPNRQQNDVPNIATGQWHQLNMTSETKPGHFLLNHTAQLVPIMPLVSGEAHRERCKTIKRKGLDVFSGGHKDWQISCSVFWSQAREWSAWICTKPGNPFCCLGYGFPFTSPGVPGPVSPQRTFSSA